MGLYIEPEINKLMWCERHGIRLTNVDKEFYNNTPEGYILVCLVDNGAFHAGLVAFNRQEFNYVLDNPDNRPKTWYLIQKRDVKSVSPRWDDFMGAQKAWYKRISFSWKGLGVELIKMALIIAILLNVIVLSVMFEWVFPIIGLMVIGIYEILVEFSPTFKQYAGNTVFKIKDEQC